jgi:hypothetical protein
MVFAQKKTRLTIVEAGRKQKNRLRGRLGCASYSLTETKKASGLGWLSIRRDYSSHVSTTFVWPDSGRLSGAKHDTRVKPRMYQLQIFFIQLCD